MSGPVEFKQPQLKLKVPLLTSIPGIAVALLFVVFIFFWFFCRIEPGPGEIAVLIRKTGENLPPGQVLALNEGQKGIQLEVLPEGRYFRNPYTWGWRIEQITDVPAGKLAVKPACMEKSFRPGASLQRTGSVAL